MFMLAITYFVTCICIFLNSGSSQQRPVGLAKVFCHKCILALNKHLLVLYREWPNEYIYNPLINFRAILLAIWVTWSQIGGRVSDISKIQLVVYYQCCLLIG